MTSIERWSIVPRTMLMPFRSARDLFLSRRKNSELSAGKANVTAIIAQSAAIVFGDQSGKHVGLCRLSLFKGEGRVRVRCVLTLCRKPLTSILSPSEKGRGEHERFGAQS